MACVELVNRGLYNENKESIPYGPLDNKLVSSLIIFIIYLLLLRGILSNFFLIKSCFKIINTLKFYKINK